jgi:hypothetical protein
LLYLVLFLFAESVLCFGCFYSKERVYDFVQVSDFSFFLLCARSSLHLFKIHHPPQKKKSRHSFTRRVTPRGKEQKKETRGESEREKHRARERKKEIKRETEKKRKERGTS